MSMAATFSSGGNSSAAAPPGREQDVPDLSTMVLLMVGGIGYIVEWQFNSVPRAHYERYWLPSPELAMSIPSSLWFCSNNAHST